MGSGHDTRGESPTFFIFSFFHFYFFSSISSIVGCSAEAGPLLATDIWECGIGASVCERVCVNDVLALRVDIYLGMGGIRCGASQRRLVGWRAGVLAGSGRGLLRTYMMRNEGNFGLT